MSCYFEISGTTIPFPSDNMDMLEAKRQLSQQYPMLRNTTVYHEDAQVRGDDLVYPVILPPAKTKG